MRFGTSEKILKTAGGSFLSSHDPRVVLGLGTAKKLDYLEIQWPKPSGNIESFRDVPINRYIRLEEGKGIPR